MLSFIVLQLQLGKSECMYWQDYKDYDNNIIALAASYLEGIKNTWKKCTLFICKNAAKAVQTKGCLKWRTRFSHKKWLHRYFLLCRSDSEIVQVYLQIILAGDLQDLQT